MPLVNDAKAARYRTWVQVEGIICILLVLALVYLTVFRNEPTREDVGTLTMQGQAARKQQCLTGPVTIQAIQRSGIFTKRELRYTLEAAATNPTQASPETCKALLTQGERRRLEEVLANP